MDKHNVEFVMTHGDKGYPAGHFFSAALELVCKVDLTDWEKFSELETLVAHADSQHVAELRAIMPEVVDTIRRTFDGKLSRDQAMELLAPQMPHLSILLPKALPELAAAMDDYIHEQFPTITMPLYGAK